MYVIDMVFLNNVSINWCLW